MVNVALHSRCYFHPLDISHIPSLPSFCYLFWCPLLQYFYVIFYFQLLCNIWIHVITPFSFDVMYYKLFGDVQLDFYSIRYSQLNNFCGIDISIFWYEYHSTDKLYSNIPMQQVQKSYFNLTIYFKNFWP